MPGLNDITNFVTNATTDIMQAVGSTLDAAANYAAFGSNDRRHGIMGLVMGPAYNNLWQDISAMASAMLGLNIGDYGNFNDRMYGYMARLMLINLWEKNTTLSMLCEGSSNQAHSETDMITGEAQRPRYTIGNNYADTVRDIWADEKVGKHTTRITSPGTNSPYVVHENLYPDQLGKLNIRDGGDSGVWEVYDPNSILYKTKCLFDQRKIRSLIDAFGTNADGGSPERLQYAGQSATTKYGESRGRNLLKKRAEDGNETYPENGYNNPYCRAWTHHHKYDRVNRAMRPFLGADGNFKDLGEVNTWNRERWVIKDDEGWKTPTGWRQKSDIDKWENSVLYGHGDGLVNITPKFESGGATNIHTKDCMFSIENLAWKDYDPYSFETALSWEQRGPLGGRIMWFPPYGLTFNETSTAQWNSNTFIGRGEDVYTYVNTKRSGTLEFYMIVDHPSIMDYVSWYDANQNNVTDTDIMRYFAGCDPSYSQENGSEVFNLSTYAQPTPMTDEGVVYNEETETPEEPKPVVPEEGEPPVTTEVTFFVFFPNNYSGIFDLNDSDIPGGADFVAQYLLAGVNAQEEYVQNGQQMSRVMIPISISDAMQQGYEMEGNIGITVPDPLFPHNMIIGNKGPWRESVNGVAPNYAPDMNKQYRYRIDGTYKVPTKSGDYGNTIETNTYAQTMKYSSDYSDSANFHLNCSLANQLKNYNATSLSEIPETAYTFAEVADALSSVSSYNGDSEVYDSIFNGFRQIHDPSRADKLETLKKLFKGVDENKPKRKSILSSIDFEGYANSQGNNPKESLNEKRNRILAQGRMNSIKAWIQKMKPEWSDVSFNTELKEPPQTGESSSVKEVESKYVNDLEAKLWRCAKCTMRFSDEEIVGLAENEDTTENIKYKEPTQVIGGHEVYEHDGEYWIEDKDGNMVKIPDEYKDDLTAMTEWLNQLSGTTEEAKEEETKKQNEKNLLFNKIRYDQEYYFFKRMQAETPFVFKNLLEKIQYFEPGFHSMTPEGFNARLTFLNQCTREGNTVGVSDKNRKSASNMAFGRPPFCVLRIGDFYNQMIVIDRVNMQYDTSDGVVWDLNDEGIGVQPMLARVSIDFTFIGGSDLGGAVRRLLNAQSFNYYANTSLYDNRADQMAYDYDIDLAMGGAGRGTIDYEKSRFKSVDVYDPAKYQK